MNTLEQIIELSLTDEAEAGRLLRKWALENGYGDANQFELPVVTPEQWQLGGAL